jgi:redox-sensitive bicupin YhaK (pirin superfamily)
LFDGAESASLELAEGRYAYVHVARGSVEVNGLHLGEGDGLKLRGVEKLDFAAGVDAEVLVFDLRPHETPDFH